jgi:phage FluMu gp28-like protein
MTDEMADRYQNWDFFIGMDVGRRIDASAIVLLGRDNETEIRRVMWVKELWRTQFEEQVKIAKTLAERLGKRLKAVYVDSTGIGEPFYEMLSSMDVGGKPLGSLVVPITFTNERKVQMMTYMITLLEQGKLKISPEFKRLLNQMRLQKYKVSGSRIIYSHPEGGKESETISYHDDILWALGLSCLADFNTPIFVKGKAGVRFTEKENERHIRFWRRIRERVVNFGK